MAMSLIAITGRQPELAVAEIERLLGPDAISRVFGRNFIEINRNDSDFANRLGGSTKVCRLLTKLESTEWPVIERYLIKSATQHQEFVPDGKLTIGISTYGLRVARRALSRTSLNLKKAIKATGRSVRLVPNNELIMNSAQVLHNGLTGERGWDLCLIRDGNATLLCQTVWSQDIDAYSKRDQARPMRDARVGMLPPKLAQIIINLATAQKETGTLLDPFCGTGVILQEAALMRFSPYGTDLEPRMIEYSQKNMEWLQSTFSLGNVDVLLETADASNYSWKNPEAINFVACETFLGKPMSGVPDSQAIETERHNVQQLLKSFLKNIGKQINPGTSLCLAVPAWFIGNRPITLPLIDQIRDLGYTYASFRHVPAKGLIYHRESQVVGRQLLVIEKE